MRIVAAGVSGFLGGHLATRLESQGHDLTRLVRRPPARDGEVRWDPYRGEIDVEVLRGADVVINLGGAGVADKRWTDRYKQVIVESRVVPTTLLAETAAEAEVPLLINASAVGRYGDPGDREVTEASPAADDFLGRTCRKWEDATAPASDGGTKVVLLRTGHVLSADSVMLKRLIPIFRLGLGGRFGSGRQYFPWISLLDWIAAVEFLLDGKVTGPVNMTGPAPVTNAEFTAELGRLLRRPAPWPIPGFALKVVAGEAAVELLRGAKVLPKALTDNGFSFNHPTAAEALSWAVGSR